MVHAVSSTIYPPNISRWGLENYEVRPLQYSLDGAKTLTQRMCKVCGNWHDLDEPWPEACVRIIKHGNAPNVIRDDLGTHLRHMGTGQYLDSKSAFRAADKACGAVCVGNEATAKPRKFIEPPRPGPDIKRAIEQLRGR